MKKILATFMLLGIAIGAIAPIAQAADAAPASLSGSEAATATNAAPAAKPKTKNGKVTEVNFEDLLVQGKYHFSDEAVVTVEQDKVLDALLGVRTDFKDRIEQSATRF